MTRARASCSAATVANNSDLVCLPNNNQHQQQQHQLAQSGLPPWVVIQLWMVNSRKLTVIISGTEGGFDEQGDRKDSRSRMPEGEALEANDEDYSDCTTLFPTIISYSTLMVQPHHLSNSGTMT